MDQSAGILRPFRGGPQEGNMPSYDYKCSKCARKFTVIMSISEQGIRKVRCPKCKSLKVSRQYSGFFCKTSRKS